MGRLHPHSGCLVGALVLHQCRLVLVEFHRSLHLLSLKLNLILVFGFREMFFGVLVEHFVAIHLRLDLVNHLEQMLRVVV